MNGVTNKQSANQQSVTQQSNGTKLVKGINVVIAVVLVLVLTGIGVLTLSGNLRSIGYALLVSYTQYLEPDSGIFGNIQARITSLNTAINLSLFGKDSFEKANALLQLKIGKQMLTFGDTNMVRLKTGQLYDVQGDADVTNDLRTFERLKTNLDAQGIPMIFAYAHSELYEDNLLPVGVEDWNNKVADDIVGGLSACGIPVIDSRQVYKDKGFTLDKAVFRTDQHWTPLLAFDMYGECLEALNATEALKLDSNKADIANFTLDCREHVHMGSVGARVGESAVEPDDFPLITPNFPTTITRKISKSTTSGGGFDEKTGTFEEACLFMDEMAGTGAANRYNTYGMHMELTYFHNEDAPEGRLLILKDSFGTPVSTFFSLAVRDICALDVRKGRLAIEDVISEYKPDAVLVVYCQEMFRGKNYVFVE